MAQTIKDHENTIKTNQQRHKTEREKLVGERDDYIKQFARIQNKETQYKHELRNKDVQI